MPEPGWIWRLTAEKTREALRSRALEPVATDSELVTEGEFTFVVRTVGEFAGKDALGKPAGAAAPDPFMAPDPALRVADVGPSHVAILNKFRVIEDHLLLATRRFEPQEGLLSREDFAAAWACLGGADVLVFYNSGRLAGASQRHKHLQAVRLPLAPAGPRVPFEPQLEQVVFDGEVSRAFKLPFVNGLARLDPDWTEEEAARKSYELYRELTRALHLVSTPAGGGEGAGAEALDPAPYNLLLTREWLFIVPRTREGYRSISINGLGFGGALLVKNESDRAQLLDFGLMRALTFAGVQRVPGSEQPARGRVPVVNGDPSLGQE